MKTAILTAAAALCIALPARAVTVDLAASDLGGNALDFEVLAGGVLAIDPDFTTATPMRIVLVPDANDPSPLVWNALVDNLTGELWSAFTITVEAAALGIGSASANAGSVAAIVPLANGARIELDPGEPAGLDLGAVFGTGVDWSLVSLAGAPIAPIAITFTPTAVPEPGALVLVGIGLAALAARRPA